MSNKINKKHIIKLIKKTKRGVIKPSKLSSKPIKLSSKDRFNSEDTLISTNNLSKKSKITNGGDISKTKLYLLSKLLR
jgi:hypothetical protein